MCCGHMGNLSVIRQTDRQTDVLEYITFSELHWQAEYGINVIFLCFVIGDS